MNQAWTKYLPTFLQQKLEGRHVLQKAISNTSWLFADQIVRMGVGLFVGVWVARYLGPQQYGMLSYAVAFVALFSSLASLGLNDITIRNLVRSPEMKDEIIGTTLFLKFVSGIMVFGFTMAGIFIVRPSDSLTHLLVGIIAAGTIFQAFDAINYWFQSQIKSKYTVYATTAAFLLISVFKIVLVLRHASLVAFAWAGLAEVCIGSAGLIVVYSRNGNQLKHWRYSLKMAGILLRDSWPLIFSGLVTMIYLRIDQVMLGQMKGSAEVGLYSVAVRLAEVWYFIPVAIYSSVLPGIVEAKVISQELFYSHLQKLYNLMAFLGYLIAIPVTFLAGWVVTGLFGSAYTEAGPMLALLIWAGLFTNLGVARSAFLNTVNWTKVHLMTVFLGAVVNVGLNFFLIPRYGGMGAVIATCVAYWFASHGSCFVYKPLHKTGWMLTKAIVYPRVW